MTHKLAVIIFPVLLLQQSLTFQKAIKLTKCDHIKPKKTLISSTISSPYYPTTILIHGLDSSKETWSTVMHDLISAGYPTIAIDLRGHGESPFGVEKKEEFNTKLLADDVISFIDNLSLDKLVVIVGHSMGRVMLLLLLCLLPIIVFIIIIIINFICSCC